MIALTAPQVMQVMPHVTPERVDLFLPALNQGMADYGVDTKLDVAAFLATIAEESGELHWTKEIWGPTAAQARYEGNVALGNTVAGDGTWFRGRGLIQVTGRANYKRMGGLLGLPLAVRPSLLEQPVYAAMSAVVFWWDQGVSTVADRGDFRRVTKIVNGGLTNIERREAYWVRAKAVLGA